MDRELLDAERTEMSEGALQDLAGEAARELEPFRERLARDAYDRSIRASTDRMIRERRRLPVITYE